MLALKWNSPPKKIPSNCALDGDMTFPLPAIRVCRANPDVFPFPAPKLLMGDWDKYATDGKKQWVQQSCQDWQCDRGPCWTWEEPKTPPASSAEKKKNHVLLINKKTVSHPPTLHGQVQNLVHFFSSSLSLGFSRQPGRQSPLTLAVK